MEASCNQRIISFASCGTLFSDLIFSYARASKSGSHWNQGQSSLLTLDEEALTTLLSSNTSPTVPLTYVCCPRGITTALRQKLPSSISVYISSDDMPDLHRILGRTWHAQTERHMLEVYETWSMKPQQIFSAYTARTDPRV